MRTDELLSIGELAGRCGLSKSALRFYDECGLLRPVAVDDATGYRYYDEEQVAEADLVRRLRSAGVPVEGVRSFLVSGADERRTYLETFMTGLEERLEAARAIIDELQRSLPGGVGPATAQCVISGAVLRRSLGQVLFAVPRNGERPDLAGVLFELKDGSLRLVATDSYRLVVRDIVPDGAATSEPVRVFVAIADVNALQDRLGQVGRCGLRPGIDGGLNVDLDGEVVALADLPRDFPDYENVLLGVPTGYHCIVARSELADVFSSVPGPLAVLRFGAGGLEVDAEGRSVAIRSAWDGPELAVTIDTGFVTEALAVHVGPDIAMEVVDPLRPVTFRSADEGTLSVLVMPVRTKA